MLKLIIKPAAIDEAIANLNSLKAYQFDAEMVGDIAIAKAADEAVNAFNKAYNHAWSAVG